MTDTADSSAMRRAIDLAMSARGVVEPNPMVGCVLLGPAGEVIGEGCHERFGGPHAEPNALADCRNHGNDPAGATAVVTLEPCSHVRKKTPPCVPTLIHAGIRRVVVGTVDPNLAVDGDGIRQLRAAGVDVTLADDPACRQLLAPFVAGTVHGRPYVTAKVAVSADGKVAGKAGKPIRLTGLESDAAVHRLRGRCDAIAVGTNTVRNDDPALTVRGIPDPPRTPVRVVLSNGLNLPTGAKLFTDHGPPTLVYTTADGDVPGAEVVRLTGHPTDRGTVRFSFADVLADLHGRGVTHLLIEPGPTLLAGLIERNHIDRLWVFRCPATIGGGGLPITLPTDWPTTATVPFGADELTERLNPQSAVFFAPEPSADSRL